MRTSEIQQFHEEPLGEKLSIFADMIGVPVGGKLKTVFEVDGLFYRLEADRTIPVDGEAKKKYHF